MLNPETPPELMVSRWFNSKEPVTLAGLRGKVVLLSTFQMLCPGCVEYSLPLAQKLSERFNSDEVAVIGLHTVFEHHAAMAPEALEAFIQQYGWKFPIGVDEPVDGGPNNGGPNNGAGEPAMPKTMLAYEMRGTPTLLIFDRQGRLRRHYFGKPDELMLGAEVMALSIEPADATREASMGIEKMLAASLVMPEHAPGDQGNPGNQEHGGSGDSNHTGGDHDGHEHGPGCGCH